MTKGAGDHDQPPNNHEVQANGGVGKAEALSLLGESGRTVAENIARIALGSVTVADLDDPRYGLAPDGTLRISIDAKSFEAVEKILRP
jgi:hypothetical protein